MTTSDDLELLQEAKKVAVVRVRKDPSAKHLQALEKTTDMLRRAMVEEQGEPEPRYENGAAALRALQGQGLKVSKSKFYRHCQQGLCQVEKDGSILETSITRYIKHPRSNLTASRDAGMALEKHNRKASVEMEKLEEEHKLLKLKRMKEEGKLIAREAFYIEFAGMTQLIYQQLVNAIRMTAASRCEQILKNPEDSADILTLTDLKNLDRIFNELADIKKFSIQILPEAHEIAAGAGESDGAGDGE
jgi:hypothetical protein